MLSKIKMWTTISLWIKEVERNVLNRAAKMDNNLHVIPTTESSISYISYSTATKRSFVYLIPDSSVLFFVQQTRPQAWLLHLSDIRYGGFSCYIFANHQAVVVCRCRCCSSSGCLTVVSLFREPWAVVRMHKMPRVPFA